MPFQFRLSRPVTPDRIPSFESIMAAARRLMNDAEDWTEGKTFNGVRTFGSKAQSGPNWHMRISQHGPEDGTFGDFWNTLGVHHSENEQKYVPEMSKATNLQIIEPDVMEVWSLHYALSAPFSPRTFTVLIVTHLEAVSPRQGWIISVPFETSSDEALMAFEERGVRGKYIAVDRLTELEDGRVEWRLATRTTVGGFVPQWFTDKSIAPAIAQDVFQFTSWLRRRREDRKKEKSAATEDGLSPNTSQVPISTTNTKQ